MQRTQKSLLLMAANKARRTFNIWELRYLSRIADRRRDCSCDQGEWQCAWAAILWGMVTVLGIRYGYRVGGAPTVIVEGLAQQDAPVWAWLLLWWMGLGLGLSGVIQLCGHYFGPDTLRVRMARINGVAFVVIGLAALVIAHLAWPVCMDFLMAAGNAKVYLRILERQQDAAHNATDTA